MSINLISIYQVEDALQILYDLLAEREPHHSISHKEMPSFEQHKRFVGSVPYLDWQLIEADGQYVGAVYLSKQREIGIGILKAHQGNGYGIAGVQAMMERWPGKFYANINPYNTPSIALFQKLGAKYIQKTYELTKEE